MAIVSMLAACGPAKLADSFDKDNVIARAKEVVDTINTLDYDAVSALVREDLRDQLPAETLRDAWEPTLSESGTFVEYKKVATVGQKSQSTGEDYAMAILTCAYENATRIFTVVMDTDLAVVGLYMK